MTAPRWTGDDSVDAVRYALTAPTTPRWTTWRQPTGIVDTSHLGFLDPAARALDLDALTIVVPGFTIDRYEDTGLTAIFDELVKRTRGLPERVLYVPWDERWKDLAAWTDRNLVPGGRISAVAWSYGAWGLRTLAKRLKGHGRHIDYAAVIDGVRWHSWPLKWLAMTRGGKLELPNTRECRYWRQVNGSPYGRRVVVPDGVLTRGTAYGSWRLLEKYGRTEEYLAVNDTARHRSITDLAEIHEAVVERIAGAIK